MSEIQAAGHNEGQLLPAELGDRLRALRGRLDELRGRL
jgi:hypothetical protein